MLSTRGLSLNPPLVNASGIFSFLDVFARLEKNGVCLGAFVTKSIGPYEREGNENPVIVETETGFLNSLALPTQSPKAWAEEFRTTPLSRPVIASVFGFSAQDFVTVAKTVEPYVAGFELNLSCPNIRPGEKSLMTLLAENPEQVEEVVAAVRKATEKPIIAKLSPNTDFLATARAAAKAGADYFGCANSLGPGLALDINQTSPVLAGITGGMTGPAIKPIVMKMVYDLYEAFPLPIIAYGGVCSWQDAVDYYLAGATIVGMGSCFAHKSTSEVIDLTREIWEGIQNYLAGRQISDITGKAH